jgi:DNA-binding response OmpR family regulator
LTAKGQIGDKELGYQQGIDDYIVKPFETKELLFRVQAILRRYHKATQTQLSLGNVRINPAFSEITIDKQQYMAHGN